MKSKKITGTVRYQNIASGFWGIIDEDGHEWRPVNMPEQLKQEGKKVTVTIKEVAEFASIFMWGTAVDVLSFTT